MWAQGENRREAQPLEKGARHYRESERKRRGNPAADGGTGAVKGMPDANRSPTTRRWPGVSEGYGKSWFRAVAFDAAAWGGFPGHPESDFQTTQ